MTRTVEAGQVTAAYRAHVAATGATVATTVSTGFAGVDLDLSRQRLALALASWEASATELVTAAQSRAALLAAAYLPAYIVANGLTPKPVKSVDLTSHVGVVEAHGLQGGDVVPLATIIASASSGLLWALGRGRGRGTAVQYGRSIAVRAARTSVESSAARTLKDLMVATPEVTGWRRLCRNETCERCASRAGQTLPDTSPMWRHPGCDCVQEPVLLHHAPLVRASPTVVRA